MAASIPLVMHWNGVDAPVEFLELPPGEYLLTPTDAAPLSAEDDAAIEEGLAEIDRGETVPWETVRAAYLARLAGR